MRTTTVIIGAGHAGLAMSHCLAALEDHVVDRSGGEVTAHREPGVPGPDHDGGDGRHQTTVTVTSVGFVTMSNTADRFCDCATIAWISSAEASASIS